MSSLSIGTGMHFHNKNLICFNFIQTEIPTVDKGFNLKENNKEMNTISKD